MLVYLSLHFAELTALSYISHDYLTGVTNVEKDFTMVYQYLYF